MPSQPSSKDWQGSSALFYIGKSANKDEDRGEELVVVAGSLYLVGDLYRLPNVK